MLILVAGCKEKSLSGEDAEREGAYTCSISWAHTAAWGCQVYQQDHWPTGQNLCRSRKRLEWQEAERPSQQLSSWGGRKGAPDVAKTIMIAQHARTSAPHATGCGVTGHLQRVCQNQAKGTGKQVSGRRFRKQQPDQKARQVEAEQEETRKGSLPPGYKSGSNDSESWYAKVVAAELGRTIPSLEGNDPRIRLVFSHPRGSFAFAAVADSGTTKTIIALDVARIEGLTLYTS